MKRIRANNLEFAYLQEGEGPLVLLLHGFPDTAHTWGHQMPALAAAGHHAVAPYLRGYPPTEIPRDGFFDRGTLVSDIAGLIQALGGGGSVHLVGQDWGAGIVYGVLAAFPQLIRRAVVMAVPHPARSAESALDPKHVHRSFDWWFFQLPDLPEKALAANDFAFVDYLWEHWTSAGYRDPATLPRSNLCSRSPERSPQRSVITAPCSTRAKLIQISTACGVRWSGRSRCRRSRSVVRKTCAPSS